MVMVVVLGMISPLGAVECATGDKIRSAAEDEARTFAQTLGLDDVGVSCADVDSDGDGYVSCAINAGAAGFRAVECRSRWAIGHGCRVPKLRAVSQEP